MSDAYRRAGEPEPIGESPFGWIAVAALLLAAIGGGWYLTSRGAPSPAGTVRDAGDCR